MKKRRVLSLLSILLVSLLFSPHTFSQETPGAVVRVAPRPMSPDNDLHLVDIVIENGQAVTGYQVMLQYDSDHIEYVGIDHGNYLPDDAFFGEAQVRDTDPNDSLQAILFAATAFPNQSEGDGVLATLTFETILAESSDLTLLDVTLLSHDVVDNTPALSSPQLENSRTHVVKSPDIEKVVQATYSYKGVFLFREDPEPITTLEEIIRRDEWGNEHYDLDGDGDITSTDLAWMTLAVKLDVNDDGKINTQDRNAVENVFDKKGSRPEDINGDRKVNIQDIILVNTAILAVENLALQWSNLPVEKVVQATYSHEGVFLFREDPETAVVTLEEMVRRGESDPDYDLDGDGKITSTDLAWMRFAMRLDVNDDGKIDLQDQSRQEDVNGDGVVNIDDRSLVETAISAVENLALQWSKLPQNNVHRVVQATYSHEGVFLFREDPETAVVTLEEIVEDEKSDNLRYDLDGDGKITETDLAWMRFALRLDVNDDGKIDLQDKEAVSARTVFNKTGIRPEDVDGNREVNIDDVVLVQSAISAVENLLREWNELPVEKVVQATYSHEGVFLFREDPETAVVTLEEMVKGTVPDNLLYDLDGDEDITRTDLLWMRFALRLDVNDNGKIDDGDYWAVQENHLKTGIRPEDISGDREVNYKDRVLLQRALSVARPPVVHVIWYHPLDVAAYYKDNNDDWEVNIESMVLQILTKVDSFYDQQLERPDSTSFINPGIYVIRSKYNHEKLVEKARNHDTLARAVFNDLNEQWQQTLRKIDMSRTNDIYLAVVQSDARIIDSAGARGAAFEMFDSNTRRFSVVSTGNIGYGIGSWQLEEAEAKKPDEIAQLIAHELGHNFGLLHTFEPNHIMGYCRADTLNGNDFTEPQKAWLKLHPAFNNSMAHTVRGTQDAMFSVVSHDQTHQTLTIKVTTQNGDANKSVSQFVVKNPSKTNRDCEENEIGLYESVETWEGPDAVQISYGNWVVNGTASAVSIHIIDAHGHITEWVGKISELTRTDFPAPVHVSLLPERTGLLPNYPNPFNPETWIPFQLAQPADVALTIYDINGRVVRDLDLGHQRAGMYHSRARAAYWDGRNAVGEPVASGIYFYTLKAGDFNATRKMLIRK